MNRHFKTLLFAAVLAPTAVIAAPEQLLAVCQSCHGPNGAKPIAPTYPVLAGQYENYIERALQEYREGKRKNPIMGAQAATLSDEDIRSLAQYFARQESPLYTPTLPPATAAAQP